MNFHLMHPRDQLVLIMERIYGYGMTTTSGGNLSILDEENCLWITPSGVDKGSLRAEDMMCVRPDGSIRGIHRPSIEYPFHLAIYQKRPDLKAILHAHPPALVAFSIVHRIPDTRIIPQARHVCGEVGYVPYAIPGSQELGQAIAEVFGRGCEMVVLENHGVVAAGTNLLHAFQRFETLDFCARLFQKASLLGTPRPLTDAQFALFQQKRNDMPEYTPSWRSSREKELRKMMCRMIRRAYEQRLVTSTEGTFSARVDPDAFLITPYGIDRKYVEVEDLICIRGGKKEAGTTPSRSVLLHARLYEEHPEIGAIIIAHPPHIMAFGISDTRFDPRTIPESYVVLRETPVLPYGTQFMDMACLSATLSPRTPLLIVENDCVIAMGKDLLQAYDRIEVAEFSAKAILAARALGEIRPITSSQVEALHATFFPEEGIGSLP